MTDQRYIDEVLLPHARLFRGAFGNKFVFIDDNVTCHRTLAVQDCPRQRGYSNARMASAFLQADLTPLKMCGMLWGGKRYGYPPTNKKTPPHPHSQRNGINCLNSCWIMLCKAGGIFKKALPLRSCSLLLVNAAEVKRISKCGVPNVKKDECAMAMSLRITIIEKENPQSTSKVSIE
ncbi:hypothetical protein TNCV_4303891 [Trichonephila clavipes]|nr:hypothetical protein TNCV_4303891 [Trichonephila clavipes]